MANNEPVFGDKPFKITYGYDEKMNPYTLRNELPVEVKDHLTEADNIPWKCTCGCSNVYMLIKKERVEEIIETFIKPEKVAKLN